MKTTGSLLAEHSDWLSLYRETSQLAAAGYPSQLTDEQADAYRTLPDLLDRCQEAWLAIPEASRPLHYLLSC